MVSNTARTTARRRPLTACTTAVAYRGRLRTAMADATTSSGAPARKSRCMRWAPHAIAAAAGFAWSKSGDARRRSNRWRGCSIKATIRSRISQGMSPSPAVVPGGTATLSSAPARPISRGVASPLFVSSSIADVFFFLKKSNYPKADERGRGKIGRAGGTGGRHERRDRVGLWVTQSCALSAPDFSSTRRASRLFFFIGSPRPNVQIGPMVPFFLLFSFNADNGGGGPTEPSRRQRQRAPMPCPAWAHAKAARPEDGGCMFPLFFLRVISKRFSFALVVFWHARAKQQQPADFDPNKRAQGPLVATPRPPTETTRAICTWSRSTKKKGFSPAI